MNKRNLYLVAVLVVTAAAIFYLENMKAGHGGDDEIETKPEETGVQETADDPSADPGTDDPENRSGETVQNATRPPASGTANDFLSKTRYEPDQEKIMSSRYPVAPDLQGISGYINSEEFTLEQLRGKVVLVDFWTYSCINCIRTQPYLNAWHETYAGDGLVIVGVHTPEFGFEEDYDNVVKAVSKAGIKYPVVQDNDYETWRAYRNRYWPRKYLLDIDGLIRYDHIGEGAYDQTENMIKALLEERSSKLGMQIDADKKSGLSGTTFVDGLRFRDQTPEIYFGYKFSRGNFGSPEGFRPEKVNSYAQPESLVPNKAYLAGEWLNKEDYSELAGSSGKILLNYTATKVNIVASSEVPAQLNLALDGQKIPTAFMGDDGLNVTEEKLYNIVGTVFQETHLLEIEVSQPGFRIYTFTFG